MDEFELDVDEPIADEQTSDEDDDSESTETELLETESDPASVPESDPAETATVELSLNGDNQFLLSSPDPIFALRIESPSEGLLAGTLSEPFDTLVVADSGLVFYASETPVSGESILLDVHWNNSDATDQLFAEFGNADSKWQPVFLFGERIAARSESDGAVEEVESDEAAPFSVRLNESSQFVIAATQQVLAVNFRSTSEGLVPGSSPAPFELFVANSQSQITLGTFGTLVTFDGEVTLDIGWDQTVSTDDLTIELGNEDGEVVRLRSDCEDSICTWSL